MRSCSLRTAASALRSFLIRDTSCGGLSFRARMDNRRVRSGFAGKSGSKDEYADEKRKLDPGMAILGGWRSSKTPESSYEKDYPTVYESINAKPRGKIGHRIDLRKTSQVSKNAGDDSAPLHLEPSRGINHHDDSGLHTILGPAFSAVNCSQAPLGRSDKRNEAVFPNKNPFDVSFSTSAKRSGPWTKNKSPVWVQKVQPDEDNCLSTMERSLNACEEIPWSRTPRNINDHNDSGLRTFSRPVFSAGNHSRTAPSRQSVKMNATVSPNSNLDEDPFDICFSAPGEQSSPLPKNNSPMWVQKGQPSKDIGLSIMDRSLNLCKKRGQVLRPGMVLFKHYIPILEQVRIVNECRELGLGPGGFYRPGYKDGAKLRLYMMCLGLDWDPQTRKYGEIRQHDNAVPPSIPSNFTSLVGKALDDSTTLLKDNPNFTNGKNTLPSMSPDLCIVNFYTTNGRLGLHQDRDESSKSLKNGLPVVSISIGDSAEFLFGDDRNIENADHILLESGDVLIFGGESRLIFHGVSNIMRQTAPRKLLAMTKLRPGRLNLTFRKY